MFLNHRKLALTVDMNLQKKSYLKLKVSLKNLKILDRKPGTIKEKYKTSACRKIKISYSNLLDFEFLTKNVKDSL